MPPIALLSPDVLRTLEALPDSYLILAPDAAFTILTATSAYLVATGTTREALQGCPVLEAFPQAPYVVATNSADLHASLQQVLQTGQPHSMPLQRYDMRDGDGSFREKYWDILNWPVLDAQGRVRYLVHKAVDITTQVQAHAQAEDLLEIRNRQLLQLLTQVPAAVAAVTGPEHRYSFLNARYRALVGTRAELGRSVAEAVPELADQGFVARLNAVYHTGEMYHGQETRLLLQDPIAKAPRTVLLDFTYQPLRNQHGQITGVLVFAVEVNR
ncbi:PAS domain-containing protein [Hymenobacter sp. GOD-10R]|uniref:PAS domain-containing protein n=1 Tax=Hymenobacter sp. GOD-10R TaxID=3093922 RepID=UPI002D790DC8|nr:PAS domain-containing protein [Hymenobacter sp. GOD-10R]WRQ30718.1 PAS domain-containing protein [Hymenobacter sp. GOD-10R]